MRDVSKHLEYARKSFRTYFAEQLTPKIDQLIAQANQDLYSGPHDEDGYPGFTRACAMISEALDIGDLWVDTDCDYVTDSAPCFDGDSEDVCENPDSWIFVEARDVKVALFGKELASYV